MRLAGTTAVAVLVSSMVLGGFAQTSQDAISESLAALGLSAAARVQAAFEQGIQQEKLTVDTALRLVDLLAEASGTVAQKEALLLVLAAALESELPAEGLADKAIQGLTQGVPLLSITQEIETRRLLEQAVRELLNAKGIFSVPDGQRSAPHHLPQAAFDALVTHIAGALGDSLEAGRSPFESQGLYAAVSQRLIHLSGSVLPQQDVDLVLQRIEPDDLTEIVLVALD